jgi:hypothetical protein
MRIGLLLLCSFVAASGCAYKHHTTPLQTVPNPPRTASEWPGGIYGLRLQQAEAVQVKLSGLTWDDDGTGPDPFVRLYVDKRLVWESPVLQDDDTPVWNAGPPRNVVIPKDSLFRLELWDWDSPVTSDPMGHVERRGLPGNTLPGTESRIVLNTGAVVTLMTTAPLPMRGVGVTVELHPSELKVLEVEPFSPAARGGIRRGDAIVGIGFARVSELSEDKAATELSLSLDRGHALTVKREGEGEREVKLDQGFVWLVM